MQASATAVAAGAAAANGARNGYGYENRRMSKVSKRSHRSSIGHSIYTLRSVNDVIEGITQESPTGGF